MCVVQMFDDALIRPSATERQTEGGRKRERDCLDGEVVECGQSCPRQLTTPTDHSHPRLDGPVGSLIRRHRSARAA